MSRSYATGLARHGNKKTTIDVVHRLFYCSSWFSNTSVPMTADPIQTRRASGVAGSVLHSDQPSAGEKAQAEKLLLLRQDVAKIERKDGNSQSAVLPLGIRKIDGQLPKAGLAVGTLHEVMPADYGDRPSAFGFAFALMATALKTRLGPAMLVLTQRTIRDFGAPCAQGLRQHGIDPRRLVVIETRNDKDANWALEETLRSDARPAMVTAAIAGDLNFTVSRRLNLAAAAQGTSLAVIRLAGAAGTSAAATRWNIRAASAAPERFGAFGRDCWQAKLERCRNGRPGEWLMEWHHGSYCFRLAESVADRTPASRAAFRAAG